MKFDKYTGDSGTPDRLPGSRMSVGIGMGMVLGLVLGVALENIALGIVLGCSFGVALGSAMEARAPEQDELATVADGRPMMLLGLGLAALAIMAIVLIALLLRAG